MSRAKILTQEEIDAGLVEAKAAVARGARALEEQRAKRAALGVTPEQLQHYIDSLTPRDRAWINCMVSSNLTDVQKNAAVTKPRKLRTLV